MIWEFLLFVGHSSMDQQSKYWCFTLNNYIAADKDVFQRMFESGVVSYCVFGEEVCPTTGTPHLQGYIEFSRRKRFRTVNRLFDDSLSNHARIAPREGSALQAATYCKKDGIYTECGAISAPEGGKRNDLLQLYESLTRGDSLRTISEEQFGCFLRYERAIRSYRLLHATPRSWVPQVFIFWGVAGAGKTRRAHSEAAEEQKPLYIHPGGSWFDGYDSEEFVLFDDFSGGEFKFTYLLKLLDRYAMRVPVKGGFVQWVPRRIYITSNVDPRDWYPNVSVAQKQAFQRRITQVVHYNGEVGRDVLAVNV